MFAVLATVFGVLAAIRARSEETSGRVEPVLATAVSRSRRVGSHLVIVLAGSAVLMALAGLGLGISAASTLGDTALVGRSPGATMVHVPGIWLVVGIAAALYGARSWAMPLVWIVVAYAGLVGWLGQLLQFPQWAIELSPLGHTPLLPAEDLRWSPLVILLLLSIALIVGGSAAFRRRDLETTA